ncbi:uncharacterized protein IL334_004889 [Kwoniella shivajii]|uniref:Mid2 domain-containing protein n=1 Tax=Kwoniella shivajii TaxID=564305 RepID=A0ABZ1D1M6_9TREE|nr:hypothetical protein IL334_004889 [Kwoniella shivajii]
MLSFILVLATLFLPVIRSIPLTFPISSSTDVLGNVEVQIGSSRNGFATRAQDEDKKGISGGAIAGIISSIVIISLIVLFIFIRSRRPSSLQTHRPGPQPGPGIHHSPPGYTSPAQKLFYPSQGNYPSLPKYTGPDPSAGYLPSPSIRFPISASIHPSRRSYHTGNASSSKGVRFGEVGVRGY